MPTYGDFKSAGASHDRARHDAHFAGRDAWPIVQAVNGIHWKLPEEAVLAPALDALARENEVPAAAALLTLLLLCCAGFVAAYVRLVAGLRGRERQL